MPVSAADIARIRYLAGAPADAASDAKWERWIREGSRSLAEAKSRIKAERGNPFEASKRAMLEQIERNNELQREQMRNSINNGGGGGGGGGMQAPVPNEPTVQPIDFRKLASGLYPWMPGPLLDIWADAYAESGGDASFALGTVRQSQQYETYYPGNRRDDGTLRYSEEGFSRQIDGYDRALGFYGLPKGAFEQRYKDLITGGVDAESFARRLDNAYVKIFSRGDEMVNTYAEYYGVNASQAAIMTSVINPTLTPSEVQLMISRAEVGAGARESGFDIGLTEATRLQAAGLDLEAARNVARRAKGILPTLNELIGRHDDPDDEFDFSDYADAVVLSDPDSLATMRRVVATEGSTYSGQGLSRFDQEGRARGLRQT